MATRQQEDAQPDGDVRAATAPQPMITVAAVARRLGVAPSTLRTWDRRYGLGPSGHTAGSHRRYSPADLGRLMVMRRLTVQGVPPAEAAQLALSTPAGPDGDELASVIALRGPGDPAGDWPLAGPGPDGARERAAGDGGQGTDPAVDRGGGRVTDGRELPDGRGTANEIADDHELANDHGAADDHVAHDQDAQARSAAERLSLSFDDLAASLQSGPAEADGSAEAEEADAGPLPKPRLGEPGADGWGPPGSWQRPRPGHRRLVAMPDGTPAVRALARAALALDTAECARLLREAVRDQGVQGMWEQTALPVLQSLGDRWRATGDCLDVEHALTESLLGVLRGVAAGLHRPRNPRPVLLACAEGEFHTLPLHVLAAALSQEDIGTRNLGLGLPGPAVLGAARRCDPAVVFVYARLTVADPSFLADLPRQRPAPKVVVGGRGWDPGALPRSARWVGSLGETIDEIVAAADV